MNTKLIEKLLEKLLDSSNQDAPAQEVKKHNIGEYVIVRCRDAGVHAGILVDYYDRTAILKDSRRLWRWWSASENTLSGVARCGLNQSKSKVAGEINGELILPEFCEIIPCSDSAKNIIANCEVYNEQ